MSELAGSARRFQRDLAKKAAGEALKKTAMPLLMAAVAIPAALLSLSNILSVCARIRGFCDIVRVCFVRILDMHVLTECCVLTVRR